jgi:uncharacterized protein YbaR (Trm112 family)/SAM-dependent methyltransferase
LLSVRYSLLRFIACPHCQSELATFTLSEAASEIAPDRLAASNRVPAAAGGLGPLPEWRPGSRLSDVLRRHAPLESAPERNAQVELVEGLLICGACGRWYPVWGSIPELIPDHLRSPERALADLDRLGSSLPADLRDALTEAAPGAAAAEDPGARYKQAEMSLPGKVTDEGFWGPGHVSPFNPGASDHTWHLIRNFASVQPLLGLEPRDPVLDTGCGYAWTTEWLFKSGYEPIGIDICRDYLEIGIMRMGALRPHLVVADVETLPFRPASMRGVLAFESFHHLPGRERALAGFAMVLQDGRPAVLAEPGADHESAPGSVEVMDRYGILERGMELADVRRYAAGLPFAEVEQHFMLRVPSRRLGARLKGELVRDNSMLVNNVFSLRKDGGPPPPAPPGPWARAKSRIPKRARRMARSLLQRFRM